MKFDWEGKSMIWRGSPWISDDPLTVGQLKCLIASIKEAYLLYLEGNVGDTTEALNFGQPELTPLIQKFSDVFEPPKGMPP